ncbi:MAG: acetyl-CoA acetyltransferase [Rhodocyclales bacterium]|nr:acetyl-CoA acetyltransferase [Rhodocyclales bacterium]
MDSVPDSTPIIVGVGQHCPQSVDFTIPSAPADLAATAARAALADSGQAEALARKLDTVVFMKLFADIGMFKSPFGGSTKVARSLTERLGIDPTRVVYSAVGGNVPQKMINDYAEQITRGEVKAIMLAGGEAMRTAAEARRQEVKLDWNEDPAGDMVDHGPPEDMVGDFEYAHGVGMAIWSYPLFEHAIRGKRGRSVAEHMQAMGRLCARLNRVAQSNPRAAFRTPRSAEEIATASEKNRIICHPYTLLMNANEKLDAAAAVIMTSVNMARSLGIDPSRWVYLRGCGDANERLRTIDHVRFDSSPAIAMAGRKALAMAGVSIDQIDFFDLYSCFPSSVELACDALGIAEGDPREISVTGGLPYFGGPGNNYVLHAVAETADWLRQGRGRYGMVSGNGGLMSKESVGIYSTLPGSGEWRREDPKTYQKELDAMPAPRVELQPSGAARIETYTVHFERGMPARGVIIGRLLADDARFVANTPAQSPEMLRWLLEAEPLGARGVVTNRDGANTFVPTPFGTSMGSAS